MPLAEEILGTNADGSKSQDYCIYCYMDGAFTGDFTMEEMVEYCSMSVDEYNKNTGQQLTCCEYKEVLRKLYPSLKRWNLPADAIPHADHPLKKNLYRRSEYPWPARTAHRQPLYPAGLVHQSSLRHQRQHGQAPGRHCNLLGPSNPKERWPLLRHRLQ